MSKVLSARYLLFSRYHDDGFFEGFGFECRQGDKHSFVYSAYFQLSVFGNSILACLFQESKHSVVYDDYFRVFALFDGCLYLRKCQPPMSHIPVVAGTELGTRGIAFYYAFVAIVDRHYKIWLFGKVRRYGAVIYLYQFPTLVYQFVLLV